MKRLTGWATLVLLSASLCVGVGCKKSGIDQAVVEGASKLPGATEAMAAIDKKDYEGAVAAFVKIKQGITTEEQNKEFAVLAWEARSKLSEAATTDPKAAEAMNALRAMTTSIR